MPSDAKKKRAEAKKNATKNRGKKGNKVRFLPPSRAAVGKGDRAGL